MSGRNRELSKILRAPERTDFRQTADVVDGLLERDDSAYFIAMSNRLILCDA